MHGLDLRALKVGDKLPALTLPPVDRTTLALFAGASGDHNPIHIDIDFARKAGMPDVFAHGMLSMAWLGRLLTQWVPQQQIRHFGVRFLGITQIGHIITCSGQIKEHCTFEDQLCLRVEIQTTNQYGEARIAGEAMIAIESGDKA
jgi:acyl dehydratase